MTLQTENSDNARAHARADAPVAAVWQPLAELKPWDKNPRKNTGRPVQVVAESIRTLGWGRTLGAWNGRLVWGHTARLAALELVKRWKKMLPAQRDEAARSDDVQVYWHPEAIYAAESGLVPVRHRDDLTEAQAEQMAIADNRTNELAQWDMPVLSELLKNHSLPTIEVMGWNAEDLAKMAGEMGGIPDEKKDLVEVEVPELPKVPVTREGDVWTLGRHRLYCGKVETGARIVCGAERARLVFTDPPYNIASERPKMVAGTANTSVYSDLQAAAWDHDFKIVPALDAMLAIMEADASMYVFTSHFLAGDIWAWMKPNLDFYSWCVWTKSNPMPSLMKRHWTWCSELVCYGTRGKHTFNFPAEGHALSTWEIAKVIRETEHPTEKPVTVPAHAIKHSSRAGDIVFDGFGGSGSTLLACEQLGRSARVTELSPQWCDVIVSRYETLTGGKATRTSA